MIIIVAIASLVSLHIVIKSLIFKGLAYCGEHISAHKLPRMILFLPDLPKNPMGKIVKDRLRKQLAEKLNEARRSNTKDGKG